MVAEGLGYGALCHGVGLVFLFLDGPAPPTDLLVATAILWCGSYALAGFALRSRLAVASFVATAPLLLGAVVSLRAGGQGFLVIAAGWCALVALARCRSGWLATLAGAIAGHELFRFHAHGYSGLDTEPIQAGRFGLTLLLAGGFLLVGRAGESRPIIRRVGVVSALVGLSLSLPLGNTDDRSLAPERTGEPGRSPVVLIVLDTLRADHLGIHGYPRTTMPALETFAEHEAIIVDRALSNAPASLPTHASLFTGLYPPNHGANYPSVEHESPPVAYPLKPGTPTLAEGLQEHGYWTVGVAANYGTFDPQWGLHRGFDSLDVSGPDTSKRRMLLNAAFIRKKTDARPDTFVRFLDAIWPFRSVEFFEEGPPYRRAEKIVDDGIRLVDRAGDAPFFLFLNFFDPHAPLLPPASYRDRPPNRIGAGTFESFEEAMNRGERPATEAEFADVRALYDAELAYLDVHLERLLERLRAHPDWDEMLVIVTSDHGESLGEHRAVGHALTLYDDETWVPLILKPPASQAGLIAPARWPGPFQSVDVFATIAAHAGLDSEVDGLAWAEGREASRAWAGVWRSTLKLSDRFARNLQLIERDGWKLIQASRPVRTEIELYEIEADPDELRDLAGSEPDRVDALATGLLSDVSMPERELAPESDETLERLRALGYVD